jgi:hypothetical protein
MPEYEIQRTEEKERRIRGERERESRKKVRDK